MMNRFAEMAALASLSLALISCSSGGPAPVAKGSPEFYWQAARETFNGGDAQKASDHLKSLLKGKNEFTTRAQAWQAIVLAGMAAGQLEMAETFETGNKVNKSNPTPFRKKMSDYRTLANQTVLAFAEAYGAFVKDSTGDKVTVELPFPPGTSGKPAELDKLASGILLADADIEALARRVQARNVILTVADAVGATGDAAKAKELLRLGTMEVPKTQFMLAMAKALNKQADLHGKRKLDQPDKAKFLLAQAQQALAAVPEGKEKKEVAEDLKKKTKI